jgi:hypothetical protein
MTPAERARRIMSTAPENLEQAICEEIQAAVRELLEQFGTRGECRNCHAPVVWIKHTNNKNVSYSLQGIDHYITCPDTDKFREKGVYKQRSMK